MQALEALRQTMATVADLQSIVRTMKSLATVSIKQYERALASLGDYNRAVEMGLYVALRDTPPESPPMGRAKPGRLAAVVFGSDRGLCGRYNEEMADFAMAQMARLEIEPADRLILSVGARVEARLEGKKQPVQECFFVPGSVAGITETVQQIALQLDTWRQEQNVTQALLFYHEHTPTNVRTPTYRRLLPLHLHHFTKSAGYRWPSKVLPTFTMERRKLLAALVQEYFFVSIYHACAASLASEHASRLASMQTAEKNIQERLQELATQFHQQRQESITEELLDVVSGFEALTSEVERAG
jgi:F-type H+-transporting ATPase subunit gamma